MSGSAAAPFQRKGDPVTDRPPSTSRTRRPTAVLVLVITAICQGVSRVIEQYLQTNPDIDLGILRLRLGYNTGVAFSFGANWPPAILIGATALFTAALAAVLLKLAPTLTSVERAGGAAVIAGALSNVVDRAVRGAVTDYFWTGWFATFNLADVAITLGAAALIVGSLLGGDRGSAAAPVSTREAGR